MNIPTIQQLQEKKLRNQHFIPFEDWYRKTFREEYGYGTVFKITTLQETPRT